MNLWCGKWDFQLNFENSERIIPWHNYWVSWDGQKYHKPENGIIELDFTEVTGTKTLDIGISYWSNFCFVKSIQISKNRNEGQYTFLLDGNSQWSNKSEIVRILYPYVNSPATISAQQYCYMPREVESNTEVDLYSPIDWKGFDPGVNNWSFTERTYQSVDFSFYPADEYNKNQEGKTRLYLQSEDSIGNIVSAYTDVMIDSVAPQIRLVNPSPWYINTVEFYAENINPWNVMISTIDESSWTYTITDPDGVISSGTGNVLTPTKEGNNRIHYTVSDLAGNVGDIYTNVMVDRTAPIVNLTKLDGNILQIDIDDTNQGLDVSGIDYYQYQITENSVTSGWISVDYSECSSCYGDANTLTTTLGGFQLQNDYIIEVRAIDVAGNQSEISTITYTGDKTLPVIDSFEARCSGELIDINDYSSTISTINSSFSFTFTTPSGTHSRAMRYLKDRVVEIFISATDEVTGSGLPGEIFSVYYTTDLDSSPHYFNIGEPLIIDTNAIDIPDNSIFEMYLQFYAVDMAENVSEPYECGIVVNTYAPAPPKIISPSHRYADIPEDSVPFHNAEFDFKMNVQEDVPVNNLSGFRWELLRGYSVDTATSVDSGLIDDDQLFLQDLGDNEVNEYYYLKVWAIGDNGRESLEPAVHVFRVDSTPSMGLKLYSPTHSDENVYYNNSKVVITSDRPLAFSGVAHYYYLYSDENILPESIPENYILTDDWHENPYPHNFNLFMQLNLIAVHEDGAGDVYFAVCAEDFSGNRLYDEIKISFDTNGANVEFEASTSFDDFYPYINLNDPADNIIDNIDHYAVKLLKKYSEKNTETIYNWMNLPSETASIQFYSLDSEMEYIIALVRVYDKSGNYSQYNRSYNVLTNQDFPVSNDPLPYEIYYGGFQVFGEYQPTLDTGTAFIRIPETLNYKISGVPQQIIELTDTIFRNDTFLMGTNPTINFECNLNGYPISVNEIILNNGYSTFTNITYNCQINSNTIKSLNFPSMTLYSKTNPVFLSSYGDDGEVEYLNGFQTVLPIQDLQVDSIPAWLFRRIPDFRFINNHLVLRGKLDLNLISNSINAYVLFAGNCYYELPVSNMSISPELNPIEGQIISDFYLETLNNKFFVTEALIREDKIIILKSQLLLNELITDDEISVENFSIDINGQCAELIDFRSSPFTMGSNVTVDALGIEDGKLIVRTGKLNTENGFESIDGSVLTEAGIPGITGDYISNYSIQLHGFNITEGIGVNDNGFITLRECKLNLPSNYNSSQVTLENLSFNEGDHSIITVGTSTESVVIHDNAYGNDINIQGIRLDDQGVFVETINIISPPFIGLVDEPIQLTSLQLLPDGTLGNSEASTAYNPVIEGFSFENPSISFQEDKLVIDHMMINLSDNYIPETLEIDGFSVNFNNVVDEGHYGEKVTLNIDDWNLDLQNIIFNNAGLYARAELNLPNEMGDTSIIFENFRINPDGTFDSGVASEESYVMIHGWVCKASAVSLTPNSSTGNCELKIGTDAVQLYAMMGGGELPIPNVVLNAYGELVNSGTGGIASEGVIFLSTNGFDVSAQNYRFTSTDLILRGKIYLPLALDPGDSVNPEDFMTRQFADYTSTDFSLDSSGIIRTPSIAETPIDYNLGGWNLSGYEYFFNENGFSIGETHLTAINNLPYMVFPDMTFYPDGEIKNYTPSYQEINFPILQEFEVEFSVTEFWLSHQGINTRAFVNLPPIFGENTEIYFDCITLHSDGSLSSEAVVLNLKRISLVLILI